MAPFVKWLGAGSLLAGLVAAVTSRLARRKRKPKPGDAACGPKDDRSAEATAPEHPACSSSIGRASCSSSSSTSQVVVPPPLGAAASTSATASAPWRPTGRHPRQLRQQQQRQPHYAGGWAPASNGTELSRRSSDSLGTAAAGGSGLLSRLLVAAGRLSESLSESAVSCSGDTAGSSIQGGGAGGDEYDSSEEQDTSEGGAESSRSGYGKSDRARLVDLWIESALLVSRDVRLDKRHFDRTTRQNLKKMRPASAQLVLSEIADRCWEATPDIAKEVHRLVSHAKAQDKFASASSFAAAPPLLSSGLGRGETFAGPAAATTGAVLGAGWGLVGARAGGAGLPRPGAGGVVTTAVMTTALLTTTGRAGGATAAGAGPLALGPAAAAPAGGAGGAVRYAVL